MAINRAPWNALVDDSGQNLDGSIWNKAAIKDVLLDPIDTALAPPWTIQTFDAGNFGASGGLWTVTAGNVLANAYMVKGKELLWKLFVQNSTIAGTPASLNLVLPAGLTVAFSGEWMSAPYWTAGVAAGTTLVAPVSTLAPNFLLIERDYFGTPWAAGALYFSMSLQIAIT